jgi:glutamate/tyrosine decarboxylase-like PLP-dependent enzyme
LDHKYQGTSKAPDYRHWQLALGRRFRSLRVWITLRTYGQEYIREYLRKHIKLATLFLDYIETDARFESCGQSLALAYFRLKGDDSLTKKLLDRITERKNVYMIPAFYQEKVIIRFVICGMDPQEKDIEYAWNEIKNVADEMFAEIEAEEKVKIDENNNREEINDKINIITDSFAKNVLCFEEEKTKN